MSKKVLKERKQVGNQGKREHGTGLYTLSLIFLCTILLLPTSSIASYLGDEVLGQMSENKRQIVGKIHKQILINTKGEVPHDPLRLAVLIVEVSEKHKVEPKLVAAIAAVESLYFVGAINGKTKDYGIMQISGRNIRHHKWDKKKILTDIRYSLNAGATVLSWFQKRYRAKEPGTWFCRYNVGTRSLTGKSRKSKILRRICEKYVRKVRENF